jgi:hypothetical protein
MSVLYSSNKTGVSYRSREQRSNLIRRIAKGDDKQISKAASNSIHAERAIAVSTARPKGKRPDVTKKAFVALTRQVAERERWVFAHAGIGDIQQNVTAARNIGPRNHDRHRCVVVGQSLAIGPEAYCHNIADGNACELIERVCPKNLAVTLAVVDADLHPVFEHTARNEYSPSQLRSSHRQKKPGSA